MKLYISFCTTSEPWPEVRAKSAVSSKTGRQHLAVAVERAEPLDLARDALPERHLGRDDVVRPARTLDLAAHCCARARAELDEKRVLGELGCERRLAAVAGMDDRVRRVRVEERGDRRLQHVPVAAGEIGAADRAGEEHVAREEVAVGEEGEVRRRVARARA